MIIAQMYVYTEKSPACSKNILSYIWTFPKCLFVDVFLLSVSTWKYVRTKLYTNSYINQFVNSIENITFCVERAVGPHILIYIYEERSHMKIPEVEA